MKTLTITAALGASLMIGASAQATLIAHDSFHTTSDGAGDTYSAGVIVNQSPTASLSGFTGSWVNSNVTYTGDVRVEVASLNHGLITGSTSEGRVFTATGTATRGLFREVDYSVSGVSEDGEAAYYFSFAMSSDGEKISGLGLREHGPSNSVLDDSGLDHNGNPTPVLGGVSVGFNGNNLAVWVNGVTTTILNDYNVGETYFSLVEVLNNGAGNNDVVNVSIFDSSNTDLLNPTASVSVTDQDVTGTFDYLAAIKGGAEPNQTYYDEFRYGTTMDSVVVPEPASLALLGLGGLCLAARRRRN